MDIDERKIGQWPNVAIEAGTPPEEAMERHGVEPGGKAAEGDGGGDSSPDKPTDGKTPVEGSIGAENGPERDTREKLEAEIDKFIQAHSSIPKFVRVVHVTRDTVMGWLDRQAAITERECLLASEREAERQSDRILELHNERAGLLDENGRMLAEIERLRGLVASLGRKQPRTFDPEDAGGTANLVCDHIRKLEQERVERDMALESLEAAKRELAALLTALDGSGIRHTWHLDVGMWEVYTPGECGARAVDADAIEDALVRFAWQFLEADTKLAEHRLVRATAREIAGCL